MGKLFQHCIFVLRFRYFSTWSSIIRKKGYGILGMKSGNGTVLRGIKINWPHQVSLGNKCILEHGITIKFDRPWQSGPSILIGDRVFIGNACEFNITKGIEIGNDTNIASGCRFVDHNHGTRHGKLIGDQVCPEEKILIGSGVWLGCNVIVLKGVVIGEGAVVAAGAVVTKSILPNEIWAGVPARKISARN